MTAIFAFALRESNEGGFGITFLRHSDVTYLCQPYDPLKEGDRERAIDELLIDVKMTVQDNSNDELHKWIFIDGTKLIPSININLK